MPIAAIAMPVPMRERRGPEEATTSGVVGAVGSKEGAGGGFQPGRSWSMGFLSTAGGCRHQTEPGHHPPARYENAENNLTPSWESGDAQSLQYQAADYNGWQTAYAFDVIRGVKGAAEDPADSRKAFLASGQEIQRKLNLLKSNTDLTPDEAAALTKADAAIVAFNDVDKQVVGNYRAGTPAGIAKANDLVLTTEIANDNTAAASLQTLVDSATAKLKADVADAESGAARNKAIVIAVVLIGMLLVGLIVLAVIRSITTPLVALRDRLADIADGDGDLTARVPEDVAAGAEQMGAAITEIARNTTEAARVAQHGLEVVTNANDTVTKLGESSREIGEVRRVIAAVAAQTNLLALNATIGRRVRVSSARALRSSPARSRTSLAKRRRPPRTSAVASARSRFDAQSAVASVGQIGEAMQGITEFQVVIAAAVDEQIATTNELSRKVANAAAATTDIANDITGVSEASMATASDVNQSLQAIQELAVMFSELQRLVGRFRY